MYHCSGLMSFCRGTGAFVATTRQHSLSPSAPAIWLRHVLFSLFFIAIETWKLKALRRAAQQFTIPSAVVTLRVRSLLLFLFAWFTAEFHNPIGELLIQNDVPYTPKYKLSGI